MTLYEELELTSDCSAEDIKQQYRTLARQHHPDLGGDEEKFKRIKFAYEVLSDPVRRKQYDETKTTNEPTDIRKEAIDQLASMFFSIIPNFDCINGNLVATLKQTVVNTQSRINADILMNENYINNLEIVKKKLKLKNPNDEDIVMSFVEKQLEIRYNDRKSFEHRLVVIDVIITILEKYDYGFVELFNQQPVMETETNIQ